MKKRTIAVVAALVVLVAISLMGIGNKISEKSDLQQEESALQPGRIPPEAYEKILNHADKSEKQAVENEQASKLREMLSGISAANENDNRISYDIVTDNERALLPECDDALFTQSPVDIERITTIEPRGSTNPPEHTLASSSTDTYIAVDTRGTEKTVPIYAPADIWIIFIQPRYGITSDPEDHVIQYALCRDVFGTIDHVKEFSAEMKEIVENYECKYGGTPGDERCPLLLVEPVRAGALLGAVGRMQGNFNFGTWDLRHNNSFVNPQRYGTRSLHSTCPFDYYSGALKEQLVSLIGREDRDCGTVEYDIPGTAQGEWFYGSAGNRMHGDWVNHLFLGYSNIFPEVAVISVGGVISEPLKWMFVPKSSGTVNAKFHDIKDGSLFCYENDGNGKYRNYEKGLSGKILVQLVDSDSLKIEYQPGKCLDSNSFVNPKIYNR